MLQLIPMLIMLLLSVCSFSIIQVFGNREASIQKLSFKLFIGSGSMIMVLVTLLAIIQISFNG